MTDKYVKEIILTKKALEQIAKHAWNGNIREMETE
jgi:transcriptional regulator with PAS, ATPase and Fis domain